jgi:hypothetical protein
MKGEIWNASNVVSLTRKGNNQSDSRRDRMTLKDKGKPRWEEQNNQREEVFKIEDVAKAVSELKARVKIGSPSDARGFRPNEACPKFYDMTKDEVLNAVDEIFGDFGDYSTQLELWKAKLVLKSEERKMPMEEAEKELNDYISRVKKAKA